MPAFSLQQVKEYFEENNCFLLSTYYINQRKKLDYICECGNTSQIAFNEFKRGSRCMKCCREKNKTAHKLSYEYVKQYFNNNNCVLLSTAYIKNSKKLDYICSCGNKSSMTFGNFKDGYRCKQCGHEKREQNRFKRKKTITPSGKTIYLQGYEPRAYKILLEKYTEEEIKVGINMPKIWYIMKNKNHRYYPDFFIPKDNLIVEVKSDWTYRKQLGKNLIKRRACLELGYNYNFMVL